MENQTTIFDMLYPKKKITKPIRLIELFSGYGSQALALKYLGVKFEHWKICEWAIKSIQAYKDIHCEDVDTYSDFMDKETLVDTLYSLGISQNYNEPMKKEQIARLNEKQLRTIYDNIKATHNLVNIQQVKGEDLEIVDTDKYEYIMTYSFPCQDLSLAGKGKGMSDTSTRSGLLWEVERILTECKKLPQILLMENVPQVHSEDNLQDFNKWKDRLEELGYKNYFQDLIATDYEIPQTRNRCFMISLLGDYNYTFPKPTPLKLKLKDLLEDNVDEKYYLSDKMINCFLSDGTGNYPRKERFLANINRKNQDISNSITTLKGNRDTSTFIKDTENYIEWEDGKNIQMNCRAWKDDKIVATLNTGGETKILVKNATSCGENNGVVVIGNYSPSNHEASRIVDSNYSAPTIKENHGTINATQTGDLRIRKLTPRECGRLMGLKDEDINKILSNQSDSSAYHLFGDSIVVNVLMAIFKEMI